MCVFVRVNVSFAPFVFHAPPSRRMSVRPQPFRARSSQLTAPSQHLDATSAPICSNFARLIRAQIFLSLHPSSVFVLRVFDPPCCSVSTFIFFFFFTALESLSEGKQRGSSFFLSSVCPSSHCVFQKYIPALRLNGSYEAQKIEPGLLYI